MFIKKKTDGTAKERRNRVLDAEQKSIGVRILEEKRNDLCVVCIKTPKYAIPDIVLRKIGIDWKKTWIYIESDTFFGGRPVQRVYPNVGRE